MAIRSQQDMLAVAQRIADVMEHQFYGREIRDDNPDWDPTRQHADDCPGCVSLRREREEKAKAEADAKAKADAAESARVAAEQARAQAEEAERAQADAEAAHAEATGQRQEPQGTEGQ